MERTGFVKEKKGDTLSVCFERPEACEGCRGCSKGLLPKKELLTVFGKAEIGDEVVVRMPEAKTQAMPPNCISINADISCSDS